MSIGYELSKQDIDRIAGSSVPIITAQNKQFILNDILNSPVTKYNIPFLVHYQTDNFGNIRIGHWACMIINKYTKDIYWFDSYGIFPDDELHYIDPIYRRRTDQHHRYIGKFLYTLMNRGYKIRYNEIPLQRRGDDVATCGRYCGIFIRLQPLAPESFITYLNKFKPEQYRNGYDDIVTKLTSNIIGN